MPFYCEVMFLTGILILDIKVPSFECVFYESPELHGCLPISFSYLSVFKSKNVTRVLYIVCYGVSSCTVSPSVCLDDI